MELLLWCKKVRRFTIIIGIAADIAEIFANFRVEKMIVRHFFKKKKDA